MMPLSLGKLSEMAGGNLIGNQTERHVVRVWTDTRTLQPGDLFVALKGDAFDGHDFLSQAAAAGAVAALVHRIPDGFTAAQGFSLIQVEDTLKAFQQLAHRYRKSLSVKVVAVTGSNGKTSTKEFAAAVLSVRFKTHQTKGNLNNHIGVPMTLLELDDSHEWAVVEMGMNHPGELEPLVRMAVPDIGIITTVGWAHIEAFADRKEIAAEKSQVIRHLPPGGVAILNGDNELVRTLGTESSARVVFAGSGQDCAYRIQSKEFLGDSTRFVFSAPRGEVEIRLPVPGWHMVQNAALAGALGMESGLTLKEVARGLGSVQGMKNRLSVRLFRKGWMMDDSYNASPDSMLAAFQTLCRLPGNGRRVALLGSMGELGASSAELHRWTGRMAAKEGVGLLFSSGPMAGELAEGARAGGMPAGNAKAFGDLDSLTNYYWNLSMDDDQILVKGSRSEKMERVVQELEKKGDPCCIS